mgnify:FL=1
MNPNNLNYTLEITVNDQKKNSAYQELQALADNSEYLVTGSYEEQLQEWEKNMRLMSVLCYAFLIILGGIGIMNLVTFIVFAIDKANARANRSRIRIVTLLGLSFAGGSVGGLISMYLFRHKTQKDYFTVGMPLIIVTQIVVLFYAMNTGW